MNTKEEMLSYTEELYNEIKGDGTRQTIPEMIAELKYAFSNAHFIVRNCNSIVNSDSATPEQLQRATRIKTELETFITTTYNNLIK